MATPSRTTARQFQVLDPRTLGRPVHLLGRFTDRYRSDLDVFLQTRFNRRHRSRFDVTAMQVDMHPPAERSMGWHIYATGNDRLAFAIERNVLLCFLAYRYNGLSGTDPQAGMSIRDALAKPETATEERLASHLGRQLLEILVGTIDALGSESGTAPVLVEPCEGTGLPLPDAWTICVSIQESALGVNGSIWLQLDPNWTVRLLRALAPSRDRARKPSVGTQDSLPKRLQLKVTARLIEKPMTLGALLDLKVGDVVPATLANATVMIGESHLFSASVAEHKGKLCLTAFEDVE
jgi:flagellar motor switch protein FliM